MGCTECRISNQESVSWLELANSEQCPEHMDTHECCCPECPHDSDIECEGCHE